MKNREIKFRLWDKRLDRQSGKPLGYQNYAYVEGNLNDELKNYSESWEYQQFTGVLDKNKKDIYEGDIVKCITGGAEFILEVEPMHGGAFWLKGKMLNDKINPNGKVSFPLLQTYSAELKVLGNVFENPELLK